MFNATFRNISAISWQPILVVEEAGVLVENHRVTNWLNIFVDQGQFSDPEFISGTHQREKVQFANKSMFSWLLLFCIHIKKKFNQPIEELQVWIGIIKITKGTDNILSAAFSLADHEFIWTWPLIRFCQMLGGGVGGK